LAGLGDLIPLVSPDLQRLLGATLLQVLSDDAELMEMRGAAYESILAALGVAPQNRPSAAKQIDLDTDVDKEQVGRFRRLLGSL
jgi:hypothetical protein